MTENIPESNEWKMQRFSDLYIKHSAALKRYAILLTRDHHQAEEVLQQAHSNAWENFDLLRDENLFYAWMRSICHSVHTRFKRNDARARNKHVGLYEERRKEVVQPSDLEKFWQESEKEHQRKMLPRLLQALPPPFREVYVLYHAHKQTYAQIAEKLGISKSTVKQRLTKARKILEIKRKSMEDDYFEND